MPSYGGRALFSEEDDKLLVKYLATYNPKPTGRSGNRLYKTLTENAQNKWNWSKRHSWQAWRDRYVKRQDYFDPRIKAYLKKKNADFQQLDPAPQRAVQDRAESSSNGTTSNARPKKSPKLAVNAYVYQNEIFDVAEDENDDESPLNRAISPHLPLYPNLASGAILDEANVANREDPHKVTPELYPTLPKVSKLRRRRSSDSGFFEDFPSPILSDPAAAPPLVQSKVSDHKPPVKIHEGPFGNRLVSKKPPKVHDDTETDDRWPPKRPQRQREGEEHSTKALPVSSEALEPERTDRPVKRRKLENEGPHDRPRELSSGRAPSVDHADSANNANRLSAPHVPTDGHVPLESSRNLKAATAPLENAVAGPSSLRRPRIPMHNTYTMQYTPQDSPTNPFSGPGRSALPHSHTITVPGGLTISPLRRTPSLSAQRTASGPIVDLREQMKSKRKPSRKSLPAVLRTEFNEPEAEGLTKSHVTRFHSRSRSRSLVPPQSPSIHDREFAQFPVPIRRSLSVFSHVAGKTPHSEDMQTVLELGVQAALKAMSENRGFHLDVVRRVWERTGSLRAADELLAELQKKSSDEAEKLLHGYQHRFATTPTEGEGADSNNNLDTKEPQSRTRTHSPTYTSKTSGSLSHGPAGLTLLNTRSEQDAYSPPSHSRAGRVLRGKLSGGRDGHKRTPSLASSMVVAAPQAESSRARKESLVLVAHQRSKPHTSVVTADKVRARLRGDPPANRVHGVVDGAVGDSIGPSRSEYEVRNVKMESPSPVRPSSRATTQLHDDDMVEDDDRQSESPSPPSRFQRENGWVRSNVPPPAEDEDEDEGNGDITESEDELDLADSAGGDAMSRDPSRESSPASSYAEDTETKDVAEVADDLVDGGQSDTESEASDILEGDDLFGSQALLPIQRQRLTYSTVDRVHEEVEESEDQLSDAPSEESGPLEGDDLFGTQVLPETSRESQSNPHAESTVDEERESDGVDDDQDSHSPITPISPLPLVRRSMTPTVDIEVEDSEEDDQAFSIAGKRRTKTKRFRIEEVESELGASTFMRLLYKSIAPH